MDEMKNTEIAMTLIAYSGEARTMAFEALGQAKKGEYEEAEAKMKNAHESYLKAHQAQTALLVQEASGEVIQMNALLVHAQDHLMTSMLALELVKEIVELYRVKEDRKEEN